MGYGVESIVSKKKARSREPPSRLCLFVCCRGGEALYERERERDEKIPVSVFSPSSQQDWLASSSSSSSSISTVLLLLLCLFALCLSLLVIKEAGRLAGWLGRLGWGGGRVWLFCRTQGERGAQPSNPMECTRAKLCVCCLPTAMVWLPARSSHGSENRHHCT